MFCPQGHGSWAGDECGLCGAVGLTVGGSAGGIGADAETDAPSYNEEDHYTPLPRMSPMTRSLLVDMNSLFDDWASGRVY